MSTSTRRALTPWEWAAISLITLGALVLRLLYIGRVSPDPFYDAAVRSMGSSLHNFFFGAFEPGGTVSIDKPPVDLWLQVASVKIFGFSSSTLKLPEILAGVASVPLLFATVRRMWSPLAGIAAASAMAVLPVEVITARSDTMDAVMMVLILLGLLCIVHAVEGGRNRWLFAGAVALGLAFNVKLLESLVALPGIALFAYLGLAGSRRARLLRLGLAGIVYVAVALSWLTATLLVPSGERPYAIGSTNGSAWNAAFVFNGTDRLGGKSPEPTGTVYIPGHHYPTATQSQRDHIPILPPSATRLLARVGPLSGERLGLELLIGMLLGIPALLWSVFALRARQERAAREESLTAAVGGPARGSGAGDREETAPIAPIGGASSEAPTTGPPAPPLRTRRPANGDGAERMARASAAGLIVWTLSGVLLFSEMTRLHPRYVEGFTPAVAAILGIGVAWAASRRERSVVALLAFAMAVAVYYSERLLYGRPGEWWVALLAGLCAAGLALAASLAGEGAKRLRELAPPAIVAASLVTVLAVPLAADITAIRSGVTDAGYVGALPSAEQSLISSYVRAHQGGARYELAAESATSIGSLIVADDRPVLVLTTYNGRVFTSVGRLEELIGKGEVRYAFLNTFCTSHDSSVNPACSAPAVWIRAHGKDVSRAAGLPHGGTLYLLPGARP